MHVWHGREETGLELEKEEPSAYIPQLLGGWMPMNFALFYNLVLLRAHTWTP